jgi:hypothetical protein
MTGEFDGWLIESSKAKSTKQGRIERPSTPSFCTAKRGTGKMPG